MPSSVALYETDCSPLCAGVIITVRALGLEVLRTQLTYDENGKLMTGSLQKINPLLTVPTMDDCGFILCDASVIQGYLTSTYGTGNSLYPMYPQRERALVDQRLYFNATVLYEAFKNAYLNPLIGVTEPVIRLKEDVAIDRALRVLDCILEKSHWSAGDTETIADHALMATVQAIHCVGHNVAPYCNVMRWMALGLKDVKGFKESRQAAEIFRCLVATKLKKEDAFWEEAEEVEHGYIEV